MADRKQPDPKARVREILAQASEQAARPGSPDPFLGDAGGGAGASQELSAEEILEECAREPETDIGNGRRFLNRYGDRVRHVARVGWHGYDGRRWREDEDGSVVRPLAQKTAEWIHEEAIRLDASPKEAAAIEDGRDALKQRDEMGKRAKDWDVETTVRFEQLTDRIKAMDKALEAIKDRQSARYRHAKSSAGTSKINNIMTEAAPHVALMINDLNTDLHAFNTQGGTLRFVRAENEDSDPDDPSYSWTVRVDRHDQADLISKLAPVTWTRDAAAPTFDRFLKTILPDPEIRAFLKRYFGYALLGSTAEQCLVFLYGAGRNGKSTLVEAVCEALGDYAVTLSIDSFAGDTKRGGAEATPDLARLPGARLVSASEPEMGVKLKDALIKTMTGGEKMPVRRLHQDFIEIVPQYKIVLQGNHKPRIDDTSDGIWRRVLLVPFEVQVPKDEVDRLLPDKLRTERAGIFAWLVDGALDYLNYGLMPPDKVLAATEEYREESDPIGAFIRTACEVTGFEGDTSTVEDMFIGYSNFAAREGQAEFKRMTFSRRLPDYCRRSWPSPQGDMKTFWKAKTEGRSVYRGIRVRDEYVRPSGQDEFEGYAR